jgi:hypothetical protein
MKTQHYLTLIASALLSTATMGLAAPVNDDFANAIDLAGDSGADEPSHPYRGALIE